MSSLAVVQDVRVPRAASRHELIVKAAKSSVRFLRRQAEASHPANKDEMVRRIWTLYFRARRMKMLAAPRTTRRMLREKFGFWKVVEVQTPSVFVRQ